MAMTACLDDLNVVQFIDGVLLPAERKATLDHVNGCPDCRELLAETAKSAFRAPARAGDPPAGGTVGHRYVLLDVLGAGAMGTVYAAFDTKLERKVALKLLRSAAALPLLAVEAKSMARPAHPNVVSVYDVSDAGAEPAYLAMELVDGPSANAWLAAAKRSAREIVDVYRQAALGLAAVHAAGLVHADFKPENLLVRDDGRAAVTDFGLARARSTQDPALGRAGTFAYMAPERRAGEDATPASDQYSLCVSLYEALHGQRPGPGAVPRTGARPVRRALARGLSLRPEERFASMDELAAALAP
jgi:serine/threonine protein kinase